MNKPSKCKNCQWYGKPYWSIINPCDNCPMENVETFTVWQDPTIEELKKEIERLNNVINGLEKFFKYEYDNEVRPLNDRKISVWTICLDKLKKLKEGDKDE